MSHRETISLAHTAECKLKMTANKPDRNLRFLLGHALTLDSINLRLIQIEEESRVVRQPTHASSIRFKASDSAGTRQSPLSGRRKTPPPSRAGEPDDYEDEDTSSESEGDELALTRHPSGAAQPPRHVAPKQPPTRLDQYDEESSSDDEELEATLLMLERHLSHDSVEKITQNKPDESLSTLYHSIQKCPCHKSGAPEVKNFWDVPKDQTGLEGFEHLRLAIAEVGA